MMIAAHTSVEKPLDEDVGEVGLRKIRQVAERGIVVAWRAEMLLDEAARLIWGVGLDEPAPAKACGSLALAATVLEELDSSIAAVASMLAVKWCEEPGDVMVLRRLLRIVEREVAFRMRVRKEIDRALADAASELADHRLLARP